MTTDNSHTGKPRCGGRDSFMQPYVELVAQSRTVLYFDGLDYEPLPRERLVRVLNKRKVFPVSYGTLRARLDAIDKLIECLAEPQKVIVKAPSGCYYLWRDPRLQQEYDDELERDFGLPAA